MNICLTGGGTAGHVIPAIEIKKKLESLYKETNFVYLGNKNYIEKDLAKKNDIPFINIDSSAFEEVNFFSKWYNFLQNNFKGYLQAKRYFERTRTNFIIATGGFTTAPVLAAAKRLGIPYYIHEQNKVMGKVNRLFLSHAEKAYFSFEDTNTKDIEVDNEVYGNPVQITESITRGEDMIALGGSGGSHFINEWALEFAIKNPNIKLHLQCGLKYYSDLEDSIQNQKIDNLFLYGFVNIKELIEKANVIITRSGTSTLFELYNAGSKVITIPLPNAADDHQKENAYAFKNLSKDFFVVEQGPDFEKKITETLSSKLTKDRMHNFDKEMEENKPVFKDAAINIARDIKYNFHQRSMRQKKT